MAFQLKAGMSLKAYDWRDAGWPSWRWRREIWAWRRWRRRHHRLAMRRRRRHEIIEESGVEGQSSVKLYRLGGLSMRRRPQPRPSEATCACEGILTGCFGCRVPPCLSVIVLSGHSSSCCRDTKSIPLQLVKLHRPQLVATEASLCTIY